MTAATGGGGLTAEEAAEAVLRLCEQDRTIDVADVLALIRRVAPEPGGGEGRFPQWEVMGRNESGVVIEHPRGFQLTIPHDVDYLPLLNELNHNRLATGGGQKIVALRNAVPMIVALARVAEAAAAYMRAREDDDDAPTTGMTMALESLRVAAKKHETNHP